MHKFTTGVSRNVSTAVCKYDVRHDNQVRCTHYLAINRLYLMITVGSACALGMLPKKCFQAGFHLG